ncbi:MAG: Uma2 family endonuclease [Anaerolineae bacterium]|nr:Uma2 family endonuclease [Anaerolineae bacterium]
MVSQTRPIATVEEFEAYLQRPELGDESYEFIDGEIIEVVSNNYASRIAAKILIKIGMWIEANDLGDVTGADGGYRIAGDRYVPDVAFISRQRQPEPFQGVWNPLAPDLAVEVVSDESSPKELDRLMVKISNYVAAGTTLWAVFPQAIIVRVHAPGQPVQTFGIDAVLAGGDLLPGFQLPVRDIFS